MIYWFWAVVAFYAGAFFGVITVAWGHSIKEADGEAQFARVLIDALRKINIPQSERAIFSDPSLFFDFDETDNQLRIWKDAKMVGEMRPCVECIPSSLDDVRWTGWISNEAVIEVVGTYNAMQQFDKIFEGGASPSESTKMVEP